MTPRAKMVILEMFFPENMSMNPKNVPFSASKNCFRASEFRPGVTICEPMR